MGTVPDWFVRLLAAPEFSTAFPVMIDGKQIGALSKEEMETLDRNSLEYDEELERGGHKIVARALAVPERAMSVRPRGGNAAESGDRLTPGPMVTDAVAVLPSESVTMTVSVVSP